MLSRLPRSTRAILLTAFAVALPAVVADRAAAITGAWSRIPTTSGTHYHSVTRDPVRDRLVAFGGIAGGVNSAELFALSLTGTPVWELLVPAPGPRPSARNGQSMIYDPARDRMLVFGGNTSGGVLNDVWALSLTDPPTWTQLSVSGAPPSARWGHMAVYDPVRDRMLVMGGNTGSTKLNDVWQLTLGASPAWAPVTPSGTPPGVRWGHVGIYDPVGDRLVIHGGINISSPYSDTWELSLAGGPAWSPLSPAGTPPPARWVHGAQYDPLTERMVVFGGYNGTSALNDVWQLTLTAEPSWSPVATLGALPPGRWGMPLAYDAPRDRMVVFGGALDSGDTDDLWTLSLADGPLWEQKLPSSGAGRWRYEHPAVLDPVGHRMLVFGGFNGTFLNDVLSFELDGTPHWATVTPTGVKPAGRHSHSATYDPIRNRIIVIGGITSGGGTPNDVWELALGGAPAWTKLTPSGAAGITFLDHSAIYDPVNDRIVCYGGSLYNAGSPSPVWALSLAGGGSWSPLIAAGTTPPTRSGQTAIYDAARARMVMSGGGTGITGPYTDVWALSLGASPTWSPLPFVNNFFRSNASAVYDADKDAMLIFGGYNAGTVAQNDVWAIPLAATAGVAPVAVSGLLPSGRADHSAVFDPVTRQMFVFGGFGLGSLPGATQGDLFALLLPDNLSAPPLAAGTTVRLAPARPNPSPRSVAIEYSVRDAGAATLRVFDVRGREVRTLVEGLVPAGTQTIRWERDDDAGRLVEPGLYFFELRSAGARATGRVVLVR